MWKFAALIKVGFKDKIFLFTRIWRMENATLILINVLFPCEWEICAYSSKNRDFRVVQI